MKWFEYKRQVDTQRAPDGLKERLLALQTDPNAPDAPRMAAGPDAVQPRARRPVRLPRALRGMKPWQQAAAMAACAAFVVFAGGSVLLGGFAMGGAAAPFDKLQSSAAAAGGSYKSESYDYSMNAAEAPGAAPMEPTAGTANGVAGSVAGSEKMIKGGVQQRMVIYTANMELESTDYDTARAALEAAVADAGGYVESVEEYTRSGDSRRLSCTYRIPAASYRAFLEQAGGSGNLLRISETADDVTAAYIDIAARVDALTGQRDRLLELQAQADNLGDLLAIESQLTDVQYQLESWQQQKNWYEDQVNYCTVTVRLDEVKVYTPTETTLLSRIRDGLSGALVDFGNSMEDLLMWFVYRWPWLILIGGAAGLFFWRRKRKAAR